MEKFKYFLFQVLSFAIFIEFIANPISGQSSGSNPICTGEMMRSFGSCINYLTGGSNSSSPTPDCCNSLKSLMSNGQDCLCLIVTGGQPLRVPINRTLAISLPRACRTSGVPIECRAIASPVPAPDPGNPGGNGPSNNPGFSPPSPTGPFTPQPLSPPGGGFSPPGGGFTPSQGDVIPTLTPPGMRPTLTSSSTQTSHSLLHCLLMSVLGFILFRLY